MVALYASVRRLLPAVFWMAACFAFIMAVLPHPPQVLPVSDDKIQHMIAFAVLALLAGLAWPRLRLRVIGLGLAVFGAAIEIAQLTPGLNRSSDRWDWFADLVAILAVLVVIKLLRRGVGAARVE